MQISVKFFTIKIARSYFSVAILMRISACRFKSTEIEDRKQQQEYVIMVNAIRFQQIDSDSKWLFYLILEQIHSIDLIDRILNSNTDSIRTLHTAKRIKLFKLEILDRIPLACLLDCLLGRKQ